MNLPTPVQKLFRSYNGRHWLSRWARRVVELRRFHQILGIPLAGAALFTGVVLPGTDAARSYVAIRSQPNETPIDTQITTETTFAWPLPTAELSQHYALYHPGIDLVEAKETPIRASGDGTVASIGTLRWGYGRHVLIDHHNGFYTLYAHLHDIAVQTEQDVARGQVIGTVGNTGWATGYHLHFEVHHNGNSINPLEVLPQVSSLTK